jgi:hypothetical protein
MSTEQTKPQHNLNRSIVVSLLLVLALVAALFVKDGIVQQTKVNNVDGYYLADSSFYHQKGTNSGEEVYSGPESILSFSLTHSHALLVTSAQKILLVDLASGKADDITTPGCSVLQTSSAFDRYFVYLNSCDTDTTTQRFVSYDTQTNKETTTEVQASSQWQVNSKTGNVVYQAGLTSIVYSGKMDESGQWQPFVQLGQMGYLGGFYNKGNILFLWGTETDASTPISYNLNDLNTVKLVLPEAADSKTQIASGTTAIDRTSILWAVTAYSQEKDAYYEYVIKDTNLGATLLVDLSTLGYTLGNRLSYDAKNDVVAIPVTQYNGGDVSTLFADAETGKILYQLQFTTSFQFSP